MVKSVAFFYTTATGNTEFVIDTVIQALEKDEKDLRINKQKIECTSEEDLHKYQVIIFACGSWNTENIEGQLSPYMHEFIHKKAVDTQLSGVYAAAIGLGDDRYHFTAKAADHLTDFLQKHHATIIVPTMKIINDPYDQINKIQSWAQELSAVLKTLPSQKNT